MQCQTITSVNPYLNFGGNCREAMNFYRDAIGGELEMMPIKGSPMEVPPEHQDNILHACLTFGSAVIIASDGMPGQPVNHGNSIQISICASTVEDAERIFNNLVAGGSVTMPLAETFWAAKFGMCTDKFGINWMVNCEAKTE